MTGSVAVEQRGNVLIATLSNPPTALMDNEIVVGLLALARRADADPDVGAVVLTGDHPTRFVAHFNVAEILSGAEQAPRLVEADAARRTAGDGGGAACARRRQAPGARPARGIYRPEDFHADSARHRVVLRRLGSGAERRHRWRRVRARPRLRLPVHGRRPVQHRATGNLPRIPARRRRDAAPNPAARRRQGPPHVP